MQAQHRAADSQRSRQHRRILKARALKRAHRPEGDAFELVGGKGHDHAHGAGYEHRIDHADQDDGVGRKRVVQSVRQCQNEQQRQKGKDHRHDHRSGKWKPRKRDAKRNGQHRTERGSRRDAERRAVCQWIFEQPLHTRARKRQRRTAERNAQNARQAHRQQDGGRQPLRLRRVPQRVAKDRQCIRQRDVDASHADTQTHHRRQNSDEQQILPEGKVLRSCLHISS